MTINDQIRDEKLQYDINREAAKISALSSGKIHKYEYLIGEDILPSNQQQILEQARFTYSPLVKAFEKQVRTIEDQGEKQIDAFEKQVEASKDLKPKAINDKSEEKNSLQRSTISESDLFSERKKIMSELYDSVEYNNLKFEYVGPTKDVGFYEYKNSIERFDAIKNSQIKFIEVKNKQNEFLNKLSNIKIGKKTNKQKEVVDNLEKFYNSREEVINFFRDFIERNLIYYHQN